MQTSCLRTTPSQSDFTGGCGISPHRLLGLLDLSVQDGITTGWDKPTQEIDLLHLYSMAVAVQSQRQTAQNKRHNLYFVCFRTFAQCLIGVRSGVGVPPTTATKLQYHLRKAQISLLPRATISRTLCVHITLPYTRFLLCCQLPRRTENPPLQTRVSTLCRDRDKQALSSF